MAKNNKLDGIQTLKSLNAMQTASLYGISKKFTDTNIDFINNAITQAQEIIHNLGDKVGGDIPKYLHDTVKNATSEIEEKTKKSQDNYIKDIKGITDQSLDMELFNELHALTIPMFELFYEYDLVHRMIPEARRCLEIIKECILSPDDASKEYLIPEYQDSIPTNTTQNVKDSTQVQKMKDTINHYKLHSKIDYFTEESLKYGCKPVMVVPVDKVFRQQAKRILSMENEEFRKLEDIDHGNKVTFEDVYTQYNNEDLLDDTFAEAVHELGDMCYEGYSNLTLALTEENYNEGKKAIDAKTKKIKESIGKSKIKETSKSIATEIASLVNNKVKFSLTTEAISRGVINKLRIYINAKRKYQAESEELFTHEEALTESNEINYILRQVYDDIYSPNIANEDPMQPDDYDPLKIDNKSGTKINLDRKNVKIENAAGSVIIPLSPDTVIPVSVNGDHIGYYVIERLGNDDISGSGISGMLGAKANKSLYSLGMAGFMYTNTLELGHTGNDGSGLIIRDMVDLPATGRNANDDRKFHLLKKMFVRAISERLGNPDIVDDKNFNSLLYSLIRENYITKKEIKVTYVPEHMLVYYAPKINKDTGIGISEYEMGLFSAHLYIATLITNLMIQVSKSADREQINVEVGLDKRIEATVQKVMRTLQTKRVAVSDMRNVDTIMKTVGTFQRYISLKHNGTPLVEMETIPGQNIDVDSPLMDKLLKSFINSFGMPHSVLNALDETEFARTIAIQNIMFLHKIVTLQIPYTECNTKLMRILLRNRYPNYMMSKSNKNNDSNKEEQDKMNPAELIDLSKVFLNLPSPSTLNMSTMTDQLNAATDIIDKLVELLVPTGVYGDSEDLIKSMVKIELFKMYLPGIDWENMSKIVDDAKTNAQREKAKTPKADENNV